MLDSDGKIRPSGKLLAEPRYRRRTVSFDRYFPSEACRREGYMTCTSNVDWKASTVKPLIKTNPKLRSPK